MQPYLGPAGRLLALPLPRGSSVPTMDAPGSRGDQVSGLIGGGSARVSWLNAKKTFNLPYEGLDLGSGDVITGLHEGLYGRGPFLYVDPFVRNVLPLDTAACGARSEAWHGWHASTGTLTRSGTPPEGTAAASGVLTWGTLSPAATLAPGTASAAPDLTSVPPWIPAEFCTVSLWIKATASASVTLQFAGFDTTGTLVSSTDLTSALTLGTAWQPASVTAEPYEPAFITAAVAYVQPRILLGGSVPTTVSIAAAQVEYGDSRTDWQRGYGSPRVHIAATPGRSTPLLGWVNHTLQLREA